MLTQRFPRAQAVPGNRFGEAGKLATHENRRKRRA
jgi:hypothetical protein